jgi:lipopolysaccharide export system ATP-binding protein
MKSMPTAQRIARRDELLEELNITHKRHDFGKTLSGGERRRVEIARALATNPKFILLDEPFTGVDPKAIEDIEKILKRLARHNNIGILITDHNVLAMLAITERAYIIADGQTKVTGRSDTLLDDPIAREAYFGEKLGYTSVDQRRAVANAIENDAETPNEGHKA